MATDAVFAPASGQQAHYRPVKRTAERAFYSGMAILLCICVYIGFSPTYFQAGMLRGPLPSPILHIHGAVFTLCLAKMTSDFKSQRITQRPLSLARHNTPDRREILDCLSYIMVYI